MAPKAGSKAAGAKKVRRKEKKNVAHGHAHIKSTFNNTLVSITDPTGAVIAWASAGQVGFKARRHTIVEDGRLLPCMLRRGRLDEPLEGELNARGDDERGDAILGHLDHLRRLVLDDVEAGAADERGTHRQGRTLPSSTLSWPHAHGAQGL